MSLARTKYWHKLDDGRVQCDVCPRFCKMHEGQRGLCYVRGVENGEVVLTSYGVASGFCLDPIEGKVAPFGSPLPIICWPLIDCGSRNQLLLWSASRSKISIRCGRVAGSGGAMRFIILVATALLISPFATASGKNGQYTAQGSASCGKHLEYAREKDGWAYTSQLGWVAGYLAATNFYLPDTTNILGNTDLQSVMVWLENYCRKHPLKHLASGMEELVIELFPNRKQ